MRAGKVGRIGRNSRIPPESSGGGVSYETEATTLFAAMTSAPDDTRKGVINTFIAALKTAGVWDELDVLWVLRAHHSQASHLNWKSPGTYTLVPTNDPSFVTNRGYTGGAAYLATGWNPSVHGVNFTQNDCSLGVYATPGIGTDTAANADIPLGCLDDSTGAFGVLWGTSNGLRGRTNQASSAETNGTISTRFGLSVLDRSASDLVTGYRDGAAKGTFTTASAARVNLQAFILACNYNGSAGNFVNNNIGLAFFGGSLGATKQAALDTAWDAYLASTT